MQGKSAHRKEQSRGNRGKYFMGFLYKEMRATHKACKINDIKPINT